MCILIKSYGFCDYKGRRSYFSAGLANYHEHTGKKLTTKIRLIDIVLFNKGLRIYLCSYEALREYFTEHHSGVTTIYK